MTIERVFNKYVTAGICLFLSILIGLRFYYSNNIKDIIEVGILIVSAALIFIFGNKALIYCLIVFVASVMHLDHKSMYATLLAFTISAFIKRKYLIPLTIIYHINVIVTLCFSQDVLNINILVFYITCLIIFLLILCYPQIDQRRKLDLTADEKLILDELIKGKQLKEIDLFSKNTLTDKLKAAYKRNNLIDKNELIFLYKWECSH